MVALFITGKFVFFKPYLNDTRHNHLRPIFSFEGLSLYQKTPVSAHAGRTGENVFTSLDLLFLGICC